MPQIVQATAINKNDLEGKKGAWIYTGKLWLYWRWEHFIGDCRSGLCISRQTNRLAAATNALVRHCTCAIRGIKRATRSNVCKPATRAAIHRVLLLRLAGGWIIFVDGGTKGVQMAPTKFCMFMPATLHTRQYFSYLVSFAWQKQGQKGGECTFSLCLAGELRKSSQQQGRSGLKKDLLRATYLGVTVARPHRAAIFFPSPPI